MTDYKSINPIEFVKKDQPVKPITFVDKSNEVKDPEERKFILLYYTMIDGEEDKSFEEIIGRTKLREFIINMIECLDIHESKILADGVPFDECLTVYEFMKAMEIHYNDGFDIEDYNFGDGIDEDNYHEEEENE